MIASSPITFSGWAPMVSSRCAGRVGLQGAKTVTVSIDIKSHALSDRRGGVPTELHRERWMRLPVTILLGMRPRGQSAARTGPHGNHSCHDEWMDAFIPRLNVQTIVFDYDDVEQEKADELRRLCRVMGAYLQGEARVEHRRRLLRPGTVPVVSVLLDGREWVSAGTIR